MEDFAKSPEFMQAVQAAVTQQMQTRSVRSGEGKSDPWHSGGGDPWASTSTAHNYPTTGEDETLQPDFKDVWPQQEDDGQYPFEPNVQEGSSSKWRGSRNYP